MECWESHSKELYKLVQMSNQECLWALLTYPDCVGFCSSSDKHITDAAVKSDTTVLVPESELKMTFLT